ncbi:MAG: LCP family protein [Oscillospiraceae bacterium]|nr:LCP family protein [Oscillospiraceae bacterium]
MKRRKNTGSILFFGAVLILLMVMLYSGFQILESTVFFQPTAEEQTERKTIIRDGTEYFPRQDLTVVMLLGIDQEGPVTDSGIYNNHGAADMVMLLVFDEKEQVCNILQLNRDSMVNMPVLGIGGREAGTYFGQLALAHTYGSGLEDSCENTRKTVSDLLYGLSIDYYMAMNMDAIALFNDAVGGVTVHVTEDFSQVDPTIGMGEVKLMGQQAINFVRIRKDVGDQLNLTRLDRQEEYLTGFRAAFRARQENDPEFIVTAYNDAAPYLVTDCSVKALSGMADRYADYEIGEVVSPEGENVLGEEYFEFYLDEEKLDALILDMFYAPKK